MEALENIGKEIIALVPVLLVLMRRLDFPALTAAAASLGRPWWGPPSAPVNSFQAGIAQKLPPLPLLLGGAFRLALMMPALVF